MSPMIFLNNGTSEYRKQPMTPPVDPHRDPDKAFYSTIAGSARLVEMQRRGVNITNEEIDNGIVVNAEKLGITPGEYRENMRMLTNPQPEPNPETSTEITELRK